MLISVFMLILRNLLFICQSVVLESKALVVLPAFFPSFAVRTLHIQVPTIPVLEPATINVYLFLLMFLLREYDRRLHFFVTQILEIDVLEEWMSFYLLRAVFGPQSLLGFYLEQAIQ